MRNKAYVLAGMFLGDEGKGTFVDYLAHEKNISQFVKYNGGSQASHTVVTKNVTHKFSQLSSGILANNGKTYLSKNTVVNPINLLNEVEIFAERFAQNPKDVLNRVTLNSNAYMVTPYHKLINRLKELSSAFVRRGTVGTGVSEVLGILRDIDLGIQIGELYDENILRKKINDLKLYATSFLKDNISLIDKDEYQKLLDPKEVKALINNSNIVLNQYLNMIDNIPLSINSFDKFIEKDKSIIFEGSQGLLLDYVHGIKPNTTLLDTTNKYALELINHYNYQIVKIGIISAFASRHGIGILPTESSELAIIDKNQQHTYWQGIPRYGWFDAVLFRYSQKINKVEELFLSSVDLLSDFSTIKICNEYEYFGEVNEEFKSMFIYFKLGSKIIISDIKNNNGDINLYLNKTVPIYKEIDGWNKDISTVVHEEYLPNNCHRYIEIIEKLTGVKISLISVGPMREQKIRRKL